MSASKIAEFFETKKGGLLVLAVIALIFFAPWLSNIDNWGVRDWGFHLFMNDASKITMEQYGQFPFWNPYRCGGNIGFGHPENPILSIHYVLVLIMNTMAAIKLDILLYAIIGMFGMFMISRHFKLEKYSSFLPPVLYILNSSLILIFAEGNYWQRGIVWIPWIAYFFFKAEENRKNLLPAAFFMLMIFFDTNSYAFGIVIFFLAVYGVCHLVAKKKWSVLVSAILILAVVGLVGAVKFLPMVEFTHQYPQVRIDKDSGYNLQTFYEGIFNRDQGPYSHWFSDQKPFFLYGMYLGILPVILGIIGLLLYYKKYFLLLITMLISLLVAFGKNSIINLYAVIKAIPLYDYFHEATRFNIIFIFIFAIFAGLALSRLEALNSIKINKIVISRKAIKAIVLIILAIIVIDMYVVNTAVMDKVFIAAPLKVDKISPQFMQVQSPYGSNPWTNGVVTQDIYYNVWGHAMVLNMYSNLGTSNGNCHGVVNMSAQPVNLLNGSLNPLYRGEVYLENSNGNITSWEFTPEKITAHISAKGVDILVLNQNYYLTWQAKGGAGRAFNYNGLVAVNVNSQTSEVIFYQFSKAFWAGLIVTIISAIAFILLYLKYDKLKEKWKWLKMDF